MKQLIFLLLSLTIIPLNGTRKNLSKLSEQELLVQQIAAKKFKLEKSEEKLQELQKSDSGKAKEMKSLRTNMAKRRSSLQLDEQKLQALVASSKSAAQETTHNKSNNSCIQKLNACCKNHYPHLVMGSLYTTFACAVCVDLIAHKDHF